MKEKKASAPPPDALQQTDDFSNQESLHLVVCCCRPWMCGRQRCGMAVAYRLPWLCYCRPYVQLPGPPTSFEKKRPKGRTAAPEVKAAITRLNSADLAHLSRAKRWQHIYPRLIDGWAAMNSDERHGAAERLRKRVRDNERNARKRAER